jgi:hypothetical protein
MPRDFKRTIPATFIGSLKHDREKVVRVLSRIKNSFIHTTDGFGSVYNMTPPEVIDKYKRSRFVPSPIGHWSIECYRFYEALEWGAIPIVKRYDGWDYYHDIFGDHPIPIVNDWKEMTDMINDTSYGDWEISASIINKWYAQWKDDFAKRVKNTIAQHLQI